MTDVYIFTEECRASKYGIGCYVSSMIECLSSVPTIRLNIVCLYSNNIEYKLEQLERCNFYYIPNVITFYKDKEKYYESAFYILMSNVDIIGSNVVFHLNYHNEFYLIKLMRSKYPECRIYFTIHYQDWCFKLKGNIDRYRKIIDGIEKDEEVFYSYNFDKNIYNSVDRVICLSIYTKELLVKLYNIQEHKIDLIYNGLNFKIPEIMTSVSDLRKQLFFKDDEKIVLFVGRLDDIKGVDYLIDAFMKVLKIIPESHLLIVGDGHFERYYLKSIGYWNKITFTGHLKKDDLYKLYRIADVGVMPSFHEQCSFVAIEMMAFGLPLITSDTTGLKEMQNNDDLIIKTCNKNGLEYISINELAQKIVMVLMGDRKDFVNECVNQYKIETMSQKLFSLYV